MDLDKIKISWRNHKTYPSVKPETIQKILKKGKTSLSRLIFYEKLSLTLLPLFAVYPFIFNQLFPLVAFPVYSIILLISICVILNFSQAYKLRYILNKIDISASDIITTARYINRYKKYVYYELLICTGCTLVFLVSYQYSLLHLLPENLQMHFMFFCIFLNAISIGIIVLFYRKFTLKQIKKIEDTIRDIEDIEK